MGLVSVVVDAVDGKINGVISVVVCPGGATVVVLLVTKIVGEGGRKFSLSRSGSVVLASTVRFPNLFSYDGV